MDEERDDTEDSPTKELVLTLAEDEEGTVKASREESIVLALGNLREREAAFNQSA